MAFQFRQAEHGSDVRFRQGSRAERGVRAWARALALLALLFLLPAAVPAQDPSSAKSGGASELKSVEGAVEYSPAGSAGWKPVKAGQLLQVGDRLRTGKNSRATVRLSDASVVRVDQETTLHILAGAGDQKKPWLDLKSGSIYFFSREKPNDIQFRTPTLSGAIRGTEFHLVAEAGGATTVSLFDGKIELGNDAGTLPLAAGEQAVAGPNEAPRKTAMIEAINIIQWTLYYPAILDLKDLDMNPAEISRLDTSFAAYRRGDILQALAGLPAGKAEGGDSSKVYAAAMRLAAGQVTQAEEELKSIPAAHPLARALREMVAGVQGRKLPELPEASTASELLARSYYLQSQSDLEGAIRAAREALGKSPEFGFAWIRLAELELSFGRLGDALDALGRGLEIAPKHAAGHALRGFVYSAQNRTAEAERAFNEAIDLDGGLGNAWLGRGVLNMKRGQREQGRKDLQVAATLEPQRGVYRSYLGKAFARNGEADLAEKEFRLAKKLDPADPTAWLYSALMNQQRNRINEAIAELEKSQDLNQNRSVFRSNLLLDQDRAVRSANLASIYKDAGMFDVSVREAARAVSSDYGNYSAHLFLANSYEESRDPKKFNLRNETTRISELLMANLLAPVGAVNLSQSSLPQDSAEFFEGKKLGLSSMTEYSSGGDWLQYGGQHGTFGNATYSLDAFYRSENGQRPNNDLEQLTLSAQFKQQLTPQDSLYVQSVYYTGQSGDVAQYYNQANALPGLRVDEKQEPNIYAGYHHEWNPGSHTLLLVGHVDSTLSITNSTPQLVFLRPNSLGQVTRVEAPPLFNLDYERQFQAYSAEIQQIWQTENNSLIVGSRYQDGDAEARSQLVRTLSGALPRQNVSADFNRAGIYAYDDWQVVEPLRFTAGLAYDHLEYPVNVDTSPITSATDSQDAVSPKLGLMYTPWKNGVLRAAYTRSLGGLSYENSVRLEPTQVAGFNQAFRSIMPESSVGIVPGAKFETWSTGFDQHFKTGTYLSAEAEVLDSWATRGMGVLTTRRPPPPLPDTLGSARQSLDYEEKSLYLGATQLVGSEWSVGARYRLSQADLDAAFLDIPRAAAGAGRDERAVLNQVNVFLVFNAKCGFFSQFQSVWSSQSNQGYSPDIPGDDFWQHSVYFGYRFHRRLAEIRMGVLNLADRDYQLNPLNLYAELPRERTFTTSVKFNF